MTDRATTISSARLLLVEGIDDLNFWSALLSAEGVSNVQIVEVGGKDQIRKKLKAVAKTPGFAHVTWLAIIQDADENAAAACDRIRGALGDAGLPIPIRCWEPHTESITVVAIVLPGNGEAGNLESLVRRSVNAETAACVDAYLDCCNVLENAKYEKAWVHAFLASLDPPDKRLGHAALSRLLPFDSDAFRPVLTLIQSV